MDQDTITAIATAPGRGGVGIIRVSGQQALTIAKSLTGIELSPRHAHYAALCNDAGTVLDHGICLYFPGPHSFTGEDIVELQIHGGPVILDLVLAQTCFWGARLARPGEFSERAFLNNKMDLAQAEAIADLINSTTAQAALNASRSLQGEFSQQINSLVEDITQLRVYTEAAIDFPEEEIDFLADGQITTSLTRLAERFRHLQQAARQGALLAEGMKLVIVGKPNAGKSSLLNSLSGRDSAIVTPVEGTTRDVLRENIQIDGMPLHIADTAGLRDSADEVEQEGIRRAWLEVESADHVLLVVDSTELQLGDLSLQDLWPGGEPKLSRDIPVTVVCNKCDLAGLPAAIEVAREFTTIVLSAKTGSGIDLLRDHLKQCMGFSEDLEGSFSARRRHLDALDRAESFLLHGQEQLIRSAAGELLAEDLRQCQNCLGEITGQMSSDELLGEIFSSFCIGK